MKRTSEERTRQINTSIHFIYLCVHDFFVFISVFFFLSRFLLLLSCIFFVLFSFHSIAAFFFFERSFISTSFVSSIAYYCSVISSSKWEWMWASERECVVVYDVARENKSCIWLQHLSSHHRYILYSVNETIWRLSYFLLRFILP